MSLTEVLAEQVSRHHRGTTPGLSAAILSTEAADEAGDPGKGDVV